MALRNIREIGDPVLNKKCREVTEVTNNVKILIEDMLDTMYETNGVGLAAPQVGILKRIVVIDISEEGNEPLILINPVIIETSGSQCGQEGCLSVPNKCADVTRPMNVKIRAFDEEMNEFEMEGEGLLARAFCHEIDHLDGILYVEKAEGPIKTVGEE